MENMSMPEEWLMTFENEDEFKFSKDLIKTPPPTVRQVA
jgi:hypothetical protein